MGALPRNAILYAFHPEIFHAPLTVDELAAASNDPEAHSAYLGYLGFASYLGSLPLMLRRMRDFLYTRGSNEKPDAQNARFLENHPIRLFIRTDAGGHYRRVRASLIRLAKESGRPLVLFPQNASPKIHLFGHELALPGATITPRIGPPIFPHEFAHLSEQEALDLLQKAIDRLGA